MTEEKKSKPEAVVEDQRGKMLARLAVAGGIVAILLGVLAFFDHLASDDAEDETVEDNRPVPVVPKKLVSQPVTPTDNLPEPPAPEKQAEAAAPESPPEPAAAKPEVKAEVKPESKETKAEPRLVAKPEVLPEVRAEKRLPPPPLMPRVQTPALPQATAPAVRLQPAPRVAPEVESPPPLPAPPSVNARQPSARVIEAHPSPTSPSGVSRLFSGFVVQAGVFTSPQRAEELHAKLTLSGVPSTLETRVQVGPFKTRQEAEAAQLRLRELGIESVLVAPRASR